MIKDVSDSIIESVKNNRVYYLNKNNIIINNINTNNNNTNKNRDIPNNLKEPKAGCMNYLNALE